MSEILELSLIKSKLSLTIYTYWIWTLPKSQMGQHPIMVSSQRQSVFQEWKAPINEQLPRMVSGQAHSHFAREGQLSSVVDQLASEVNTRSWSYTVICSTSSTCSLLTLILIAWLSSGNKLPFVLYVNSVAEIGKKAYSLNKALANTEDVTTLTVEKNRLVDEVCLVIVSFTNLLDLTVQNNRSTHHNPSGIWVKLIFRSLTAK